MVLYPFKTFLVLRPHVLKPQDHPRPRPRLQKMVWDKLATHFPGIAKGGGRNILQMELGALGELQQQSKQLITY